MPSLCLATENVRAQSSDVALRVASLLDTRSMMMLGFKSMLPNETARDLADRLLAEYPDIWSKLDREYADLLSQTFSESQLHELHHFFSSDTGQAWIKSAPEIFANFQNSSTGTNSLLFRFSSIGCVVGLLAPNIDVAKQRAGNDQPGVPSELYETIEPLREASTLTCDCILTKGLEKWPSSAVMQLQLQPGFQEYAQELLSSGSCPMPIPQKQKGVNE
ncbi:MAG: DUF2059 domain-containing protein [Proteobacteria bacterium]|nr:DUF2059 domain-containing protein [Pseudomonadota bacterium]